MLIIYICSTQCDGFGDTQVSDGISVTATPYQDSAAGPSWLLQGEAFCFLEIIVFVPCVSVGEGKKIKMGNYKGIVAGLVPEVCRQPKACRGFGMGM